MEKDMTINDASRTRIKENVKVARKSGKRSLAIDLGIFVLLADTLAYYTQSEKLPA